MSRNKNNLTARQQLFLNELVRGKPFNDILSQYRIRPATLMRWTTDANFVAQWKLCNEVLALRRPSDEACAIRLAQPEHSSESHTAPNPPTVFLLLTPPSQPPPNRAPETKPPPMSEREAVRTRHGEEAAQAFDRLTRLREQPLHTAAAGPPNPTVSPPENIPIEPTPPPPPPEHSPVTAPEVQP
jgi:hypothetical protein